MMVGMLLLVILTIISVIGMLVSWYVVITTDYYDNMILTILTILFTVICVFCSAFWLAIAISSVDWSFLTDWWYSEV